jgi:hypothetical protein
VVRKLVWVGEGLGRASIVLMTFLFYLLRLLAYELFDLEKGGCFGRLSVPD